MAKTNTAIDEYYDKALENLNADRKIIRERTNSLEAEIEKISAQLRRYRSVKINESGTDNRLSNLKARYTNLIDLGSRVMNKIDFVQQKLAENKRIITSERINAENEILNDELKGMKEACKENLTTLEKKYSIQNEKYQQTKHLLENKDDSLFGKIGYNFYNIKSAHHSNVIESLNKKINDKRAELAKLNKIKTLRDSADYEQIRKNLDLDNKGKFNLLFSSNRNWSILEDKLESLDERYSKILDELKQSKLVASDELYSLDN